MGAVPFVKMQALGNDFVLFDGVTRELRLSAATVRQIADRRAGVGCDQVLLLAPPRGAADFRYRVWNADGGEVAQCGNGARCVPHFVRRAGLLGKKRVRRPLQLETRYGMLEVESLGKGEARAYLGRTEMLGKHRVVVRPGSAALPYYDIFLGNPHAVFFADSFGISNRREFAGFDLAELARAVRRRGSFPDGVNVGLCLPQRGGSRANLRVDERGAGETPACGSAAAAAAVALAARRGGCPWVEIRMRGGALQAGWDGLGTPAWIQGPVAESFCGEIDGGMLA